MSAREYDELKTVREVARENGWAELCHQPESRMVSFMHAQRRINYYYTAGTVATCIEHPKYGRSQLFRRGVFSKDELTEIFQNPRTHTGRGYFQKNGGHPPKKRLTHAKNQM